MTNVWVIMALVFTVGIALPIALLWDAGRRKMKSERKEKPPKISPVVAYQPKPSNKRTDKMTVSKYINLLPFSGKKTIVIFNYNNLNDRPLECDIDDIALKSLHYEILNQPYEANNKIFLIVDWR